MRAGAGAQANALAALGDASRTAVIAFGLLLPLIGFETVTNINDQLILTTRFPLLAAFVAIAGAGRFVYSFSVAPWLARRALRPPKTAASFRRESLRKWLLP
ncbi:MAG TPA: DUF3382 domain-containing protein, partial [Xanthobacteraceae bacterium]